MTDATDATEVLTVETIVTRRPLGWVPPDDGVERYGFQAEPEVDVDPVRARRLLLRAHARQLEHAAEVPR